MTSIYLGGECFLKIPDEVIGYYGIVGAAEFNASIAADGALILRLGRVYPKRTAKEMGLDDGGGGIEQTLLQRAAGETGD